MLKSDFILKTNEKSGSMRFPSLPLSLVCVSCLVVSDSATPWTVADQAPLSMGFSRQEYWSGLPFPSPGNLLDPGIEPGSPALQADSLPSEPAGKRTKVKVKVVQSCQTLRPHGFSPWSSPGQNIGVGSLSLFQGSSQPRSPALQADSLPAEP